MTTDHLLLGLAIFILWIPRQWLRLGRNAVRQLLGIRRSRRKAGPPAQVRESGDIRLVFREELGKFRNTVDFIRALTGGLLLVGNHEWGIAPVLAPDPERLLQGSHDQLHTWLGMGLMGTGVLIQFLRYEGRITFYAPIFYLGGLGMALSGFSAGFLAFLVGWTLNTAAPLTPAAFLSVYALLVFLLGLLFRGLHDLHVVFMGGISFLPVMISLLTRRSLAIFTKRIK